MALPMSQKMSNTVRAAALSLGVDANDLQDVLEALREIKERRAKGEVVSPMITTLVFHPTYPND